MQQEEKNNNLGPKEVFQPESQPQEALPEISAQPSESLPEKEKTKEITEPSQPQPPVTPPISPKDTAVKEEETVEEVKEQAPLKDEDLIEPKWVKEAKKIIKEEKERPFEEEEEQEDLQIKYIKERFGKNIKKSED